MARIEDSLVIKDFGKNIKTPKTKEITQAFERFGIDQTVKVLVILSNPTEVLKRSIRNLDKVKLISANQLNVFDLLHANKLLIGEEALATIKEVYSND